MLRQISLPRLRVKLPEKLLEGRLFLRLDLLGRQFLRRFRLLDLRVNGARVLIRLRGRGIRLLRYVCGRLVRGRCFGIRLAPAAGLTVQTCGGGGIAVDHVLNDALRKQACGQPLMAHGCQRSIDVGIAQLRHEWDRCVGSKEIQPLQTQDHRQKDRQLFQRLFLFRRARFCKAGRGTTAAEQFHLTHFTVSPRFQDNHSAHSSTESVRNQIFL